MSSEKHTIEIVSVIGAGAMGQGIAQIAATNEHAVKLIDTSSAALENAKSKLSKILNRLVEKERLTSEEAQAILGRITFSNEMESCSGSGIVIEAVIENLEVKQKVFSKLETLVDEQCILATNTSSLSIAAIASSCQNAERVLGIHFFNPAPLMPLVEIVPGIETDDDILNRGRSLIDGWGKITVVAKDTPGFIVNRVARPFYGEAIRIYEEGIADMATIDWAMKEIGGFRMGPFELMDYIGNDINYKVTESVYEAFFYDPRYKPSFTQKRAVEAGRLGRKSGRGFYDYSADASNPSPNMDADLGRRIFARIFSMLVNEAADAVFWNVASREDIDLAMTRGVNYPKGLLKWGDEFGIKKILEILLDLRETFYEDRYRPSPLLKQMAQNGQKFYPDA